VRDLSRVLRVVQAGLSRRSREGQLEGTNRYEFLDGKGKGTGLANGRHKGVRREQGDADTATSHSLHLPILIPFH